MPRLDINTPFETDQPRITVEVDAAAPLPLGRHSYQLEVVDDSGNVSAPDRVVVIIADRTRPTAVLVGPRIVDLGRSFELSGEQSFDVGGVVRTWRYTYLGPAV